MAAHRERRLGETGVFAPPGSRCSTPAASRAPRAELERGDIEAVTSRNLVGFPREALAAA